ncbi:hypothetical protein ACFIOY_00285 [Bradyrhizobium sp. TZ2]
MEVFDTPAEDFHTDHPRSITMKVLSGEPDPVRCATSTRFGAIVMAVCGEHPPWPRTMRPPLTARP